MSSRRQAIRSHALDWNDRHSTRSHVSCPHSQASLDVFIIHQHNTFPHRPVVPYSFQADVSIRRRKDTQPPSIAHHHVSIDVAPCARTQPQYDTSHVLLVARARERDFGFWPGALLVVRVDLAQRLVAGFGHLL